MRTRSIFTLAFVIAGACRVERQPGTDADTSRTVSDAKAPVDTAAKPTAPALSTAWTVTPDGIGAIRVGMNVEDVQRVSGEVTVPNGAAECSYVRPAGLPPGVSVMLARGQVARVDVDSAGVASDAGIVVGDSAARVNEAYPGRVTVTPHKYVQGGQYLSVRPSSREDSTHRIVFETENGRVTRFRSGRVPEVEWVERCG